MDEIIAQNEKLLSTQERGAKGKKKLFGCLLEGLAYLLLFFITLALFWAFKPMIEVRRKGVIAQTLIALGLTACIAFIVYMGIAKKLTTGKILLVILLIGYILRVGYMLYTPASTRQHDTYSSNFNGHEAYAWNLFDTGKLPATNDYQFYHPPLNALIQAGFMRFMDGLTRGMVSLFGSADGFYAAFRFAKPSYIADDRRYYLYSTCQVLAVAYSFIAAAVLVKTVFLFNFSTKTKLFLSAFVVLYPRQVQFAGMLNNDGISYLLGVLAMYYALKWQKGEKHWGYMLVCGFAVGLGMMAKLSSATVCLPIAGVFVYEFIRTLQKKEGSMPFPKMLWQYAMFLCVCAPIGLWFQIYAKARFDQGFGFVFSNLNRALYTGERSFFSRFIFPFDLSEWFGSIYCRPFEGNYYLFNYALRSSIFGEFSYWQGEGFAVAAIFAAYLSTLFIAVSLIWAVVVYLRKRGKAKELFQNAELSFSDLLFVFLLVQSQVLSEIYFYIQMPYGCTMDFRYIMPLILGIALLIGSVGKLLATEGGKFSLLMNRLTGISVGAFIILSTLFYCVCI